MKPYSVARMRKECQTSYRLLLAAAVAFLIYAAVCGALWKVLNDGETKDDSLIITGFFLVLSFFLLGGYFVMSDTKWMIRHTLYGKTLTGLGDAATLMAEIDKEAEAMDYECAGFALMSHWMVLYRGARQWKWGGVQIQSRPIPLNHIGRISWSRASDEDNAGFWVRIAAVNGAEYLLFVWEIADVEALRQWGEAKAR